MDLNVLLCYNIIMIISLVSIIEIMITAGYGRIINDSKINFFRFVRKSFTLYIIYY